MKINYVKVYQAVYLGKNMKTYFTKEPGIDFTLIEGIGVQIESPEDTIIVPYPNVAFVRVEKEPALEKPKLAKSK